MKRLVALFGHHTFVRVSRICQYSIKVLRAGCQHILVHVIRWWLIVYCDITEPFCTKGEHLVVIVWCWMIQTWHLSSWWFAHLCLCCVSTINDRIDQISNLNRHWHVNVTWFVIEQKLTAAVLTSDHFDRLGDDILLYREQHNNTTCMYIFDSWLKQSNRLLFVMFQCSSTVLYCMYIYYNAALTNLRACLVLAWFLFDYCIFEIHVVVRNFCIS